MNPRYRAILCCLALTVASAAASAPPAHAQAAAGERVHLRLVADEAEAVLAILSERQAGRAVPDSLWSKLFATDGYRRLKKRELSFQRPFEDSTFRAFVTSDSLLAKAPALRETLRRWRSVAIDSAAAKSLAYLPASATIRATIYPVIKPRSNSFVFEVRTDAAIFLFLDPEVTPAKFENTLAHEMHHIGYGTCCPDSATERAGAALPENRRNMVDWVGAFGEGFAMLAAAGGPDVHPHAVSPRADRQRWDADMRNFNADLARVDQFFRDVLAGRLDEKKRTETAMGFFGAQGPWYTVGWKMAVMIEKADGRARLIECMCDVRQLLPAYDEAAAALNKGGKEPLAVWSPEVIQALR